MRVAANFMTAALLWADMGLAMRATRMLGVEGAHHFRRGAERLPMEVIEAGVRRRQSNSNTIQSTGSGDSNSTTAQACMDTLSRITAVTNDAGLAACYNIMDMDTDNMAFTADLRLYLAEEAKGEFANVQPNNLMIGVTFPDPTVFSTTNSKRSAGLQRRQSVAEMSEIQQYTLRGTIDAAIDLGKLNTDQIMSLMIPAITVNAVNNDTRAPVATVLTTTDTAYFVVGEFQGEFRAEAATPAFQAAAIDQSSTFVLPGTTFGIFPTGMIVTLVWVVLFCAAYGTGTWFRIQHRDFYRRRMQIASGKMPMPGRTGQRI